MKNCKFNDELILLIRDTRDILQVGMCLGSMLIILVCVVKAVINSCDWWAKYSHSTSVTTRYTMQPLPISLKYEWTKQADRCELVDTRLVDLVIADTYPMVWGDFIPFIPNAEKATESQQRAWDKEVWAASHPLSRLMRLKNLQARSYVLTTQPISMTFALMWIKNFITCYCTTWSNRSIATSLVNAELSLNFILKRHIHPMATTKHCRSVVISIICKTILSKEKVHCQMKSVLHGCIP